MLSSAIASDKAWTTGEGGPTDNSASTLLSRQVYVQEHSKQLKVPQTGVREISTGLSEASPGSQEGSCQTLDLGQGLDRGRIWAISTATLGQVIVRPSLKVSPHLISTGQMSTRCWGGEQAGRQPGKPVWGFTLDPAWEHLLVTYGPTVCARDLV